MTNYEIKTNTQYNSNEDKIMTTTWDDIINKYGNLNSEISLHVHEGFCEIIHTGRLDECHIDLDTVRYGIDGYYMYSLLDYEVYEDTIYITLETIEWEEF